ncbi:MAG TPA: hypothetical protein PKY01_09575 [Candidatus Hydrogenedentes bacterium]|nr:hypothetical protein [Candidatus Hydrogenedentota bacterium]
MKKQGRPTIDRSCYTIDPREAVRQRAAAKPTHRRPDQKPAKRRTKRVVGDHYARASYRGAVHRLCADAGVTQ